MHSMPRVRVSPAVAKCMVHAGWKGVRGGEGVLLGKASLSPPGPPVLPLPPATSLPRLCPVFPLLLLSSYPLQS